MAIRFSALLETAARILLYMTAKNRNLSRKRGNGHHSVEIAIIDLLLLSESAPGRKAQGDGLLCFSYNKNGPGPVA
ncbi:MAG: hypothetical protein GX133_05415 [Syntrophomonadaceae bacterium]|nr:hypothetical protein [Syntrophomonadaceae bacterium]